MRDPHRTSSPCGVNTGQRVRRVARPSSGRARGAGAKSSGPGSSSGRSGERERSVRAEGARAAPAVPRAPARARTAALRSPRRGRGRASSRAARRGRLSRVGRTRPAAARAAPPALPGQALAASPPRHPEREAQPPGLTCQRGLRPEALAANPYVGGGFRRRLAQLAGAATTWGTGNGRLYRLRRLTARKLRH